MKVLITGSQGMVGSNLKELMQTLTNRKPSSKDKSLDQLEAELSTAENCNGLLEDFLTSALHLKAAEFKFIGREDCDLEDGPVVEEFFELEKPTHVIHLAAKVGGLFANMEARAKFFEKNMLINMNVLRACQRVNVERAVVMLSTCIYPDKVKSYPIQEEWLHLGPPHPSNEGYAMAKRMCEVQCRLLNEAAGYPKYLCVVPTNLYGKFDNYGEQQSHVVPGLIRKGYAVASGMKDKFVILGTGKPLRQFCYTPDLCLLTLWVLMRKKALPLVALVPEEEYSINELALEIAQQFDIENKVEFNTAFADGQFKKTMSNATLRKELPGFKFTSLSRGLEATIADFKANYEKQRL